MLSLEFPTTRTYARIDFRYYIIVRTRAYSKPCTSRYRGTTSTYNISARICIVQRTHPRMIYMVYLHDCTLKKSKTSIKIIKNEVGCRDDTVSKTVDTRRHRRQG